MPRRHVAPGKVRRRLTVAFVLVAGISAGALAAGSFLLVRQARLSESLDRTEQQVNQNLIVTAGVPFEEPTFNLQGLLAGYEQSGLQVVAIFDRRQVASDRRLDPTIPRDLRSLVAQGNVAYERLEIAHSPYLVVGGRPPQTSAELYFFASEARLHHDLAFLRDVLVLGWIIVVVVAAAIGSMLARRTLGPVGRASQAARDMAEGLLDTRLPVEGGDEFGAWAASFNQMADALERKITELSEARARERRFTSDVAHELRTPVAALVAEASMLREHLQAMASEPGRIAELVVRDVARLRRLVDDLMEISRLDAGREQVVLEPVAVTKLVVGIARARAGQSASRWPATT